MPFGTVKIGPDTTSFNTSIGQNAGYTPDGNVTAFSLTHVSGTGGGPVYGVVSQMPLATLDGVNVLDNLTYMQPRSGEDQASPGYYRSAFQNGIEVELSATRHAGFLQYSLPGKADSNILVDVSHYLPANGGGNQAQSYSNGDIELSNGGVRYTGSGTYRGAFSHSRSNHSPNSREQSLIKQFPITVSFFVAHLTAPPKRVAHLWELIQIHTGPAASTCSPHLAPMGHQFLVDLHTTTMGNV